MECGGGGGGGGGGGVSPARWCEESGDSEEVQFEGDQGMGEDDDHELDDAESCTGGDEEEEEMKQGNGRDERRSEVVDINAWRTWFHNPESSCCSSCDEEIINGEQCVSACKIPPKGSNCGEWKLRNSGNQRDGPQEMVCDEKTDGEKNGANCGGSSGGEGPTAADEDFGWVKAGHRRGRSRGRGPVEAPRNRATGLPSSTVTDKWRRGEHPARHVTPPATVRSSRGGRGGSIGGRGSGSLSRGKEIAHMAEERLNEINPQICSPNREVVRYQGTTSSHHLPTVETREMEVVPRLPLERRMVRYDEGLEVEVGPD
ncbi:hypothetical protein J5N97_015175 [Dioscorea zingiberensis]|uniref:Uncharacterized protein n=1 Tax=Dioscorea zingiberensis TaxID=325984 RepID=A0A9D5CTT0_9LILI|nr:hypothetical protein J5N97_015175 [Dioscorea zingiberensis]